ncbi:hypothetical protein PL11201_490084 [Planktothrix sp. PCC 11201]|uniref:hypothetical protein n=1 Tax=Planktothrix sp. PCC 11201 TaxID=1729650 RepID=UPI000914E651|nr:hypothetical protein [Planktothrix sp. PCC 11201]SKB13349.1 hypothetical protein PL11201_490084 [Planktothrix sp. PCC 11201]
MIGDIETYSELSDIFLLNIPLDQPEELLEQAFQRARTIEAATTRMLNGIIDVQTFLDIVEPCQDDMDGFLADVESQIEGINLICIPTQ